MNNNSKVEDAFKMFQIEGYKGLKIENLSPGSIDVELSFLFETIKNKPIISEIIQALQEGNKTIIPLKDDTIFASYEGNTKPIKKKY